MFERCRPEEPSGGQRWFQHITLSIEAVEECQLPHQVNDVVWGKELIKQSFSLCTFRTKSTTSLIPVDKCEILRRIEFVLTVFLCNEGFYLLVEFKLVHLTVCLCVFEPLWFGNKRCGNWDWIT